MVWSVLKFDAHEHVLASRGDELALQMAIWLASYLSQEAAFFGVPILAAMSLTTATVLLFALVSEQVC